MQIKRLSKVITKLKMNYLMKLEVYRYNSQKEVLKRDMKNTDHEEVVSSYLEKIKQ